MPSHTYDQKLAFLLFSEQQGGTVPPGLAADMLKISIQGVTSAANRGRLKYVTYKNIRHYGIKSVSDYRIFFSKKYTTRG